MDRLDDKIEIIIAFAEYRDCFVAELWQENMHIAEIYYDIENKRWIEFYPNNKPLKIEIDDLLSSLEIAKIKLK